MFGIVQRIDSTTVITLKDNLTIEQAKAALILTGTKQTWIEGPKRVYRCDQS
jgi:hypothetical protein